MARACVVCSVRRRVGFFVYPTYPNYDSLLLAALGPRAARRRPAVASRPTARRPSIRWRSSFGALLSLLGERRRPRDGCALTLASLRRARRRAVPARRARRSRRSSGRRRAAAAARASTSRSSPRAATSTSRTWRWSSGRRRSRRERPRRGGAGARPAALAGLLRPEAWCWPGSTGCGWRGRASWRAADRVRGAAPRSRPLVWAADRLRSSPATRCSRCTTRARSAEELGRRAALSEMPARDAGLPRRARQAAGAARRGASGWSSPRCARARGGIGHAAVLLVIGRRHVRARRRRRAVGDRALPARRRRSCVMLFAAVALGGLDDAPRRRALRGGRGRWRRARARAARRRLHGDARQPRPASTTSCASAATRTRRSQRVLADPRGASDGAALRAAVAAQPQADARRALARRPAATTRASRAATDADSGAPDAAASRSTSTSRYALFTPGARRPTPTTRCDPGSRPPGFAARRRTELLRRLCPLLSAGT